MPTEFKSIQKNVVIDRVERSAKIQGALIERYSHDQMIRAGHVSL